MNSEQTSAERPSEIEGHIGLDIRDRVSELGTRCEYFATREWVWKGAFFSLVGGISIGVTVVGVLIKILDK